MNRFAKQSLTLLTAILLTAPQYSPVDQGSKVSFTIKNLGFNVRGSFTGLQGKIIFDPANLSAASFDVSIDAASVNTESEMRDNHLREESYFDVRQYPRISIRSGAISAGKNGSYVFTGKLTIKNTTRDISFPFTATPRDNDYLFTGEFSINRKDFGVGGTSTLSNNVTISLSVLAK